MNEIDLSPSCNVARFMVAMLKGEINLQRCQNGGLGRIKRTTHMGMDDRITIEY